MRQKGQIELWSVYCLPSTIYKDGLNDDFLIFKAKQTLEKAKHTLESENASLVAEVQQLNGAKQDNEKKRKQTEQQLTELNVRLVDSERTRNNFVDKTAKLQVHA